MIYSHVYKIWLLKLLQDFGNFKEASLFSHMTQSAFSQNLKTLENYMQKSLVVRERGRISLTPDGKSLLEKSYPILDALGEIDVRGKESSSFSGTLRIGAYESIAVNFSYVLYQKIKNISSDIKLEIRTSRSDVLAQRVSKGELDMALVVSAKVSDKYDVTKLFENEFGLYASTALGRNRDPLELINTYGICALATGADGHANFYKRFFSRIPKPFQVHILSDSFEVIRNTTLNQSIIGLMPDRVANRNSNDFIKIWPEDSEISKSSRHSVSLISRKNVDRELVTKISEFLRPYA